MVEIGKYLRRQQEKNIQKEKSWKLAGSLLLTITLTVGASVGLDTLLQSCSETRAKNKLYSEVRNKADKNTNNEIDFEEAYILGKELNVIKCTNVCPLTYFPDVFRKASLESVSNYLEKK